MTCKDTRPYLRILIGGSTQRRVLQNAYWLWIRNNYADKFLLLSTELLRDSQRSNHWLFSLMIYSGLMQFQPIYSSIFLILIGSHRVLIICTHRANEVGQSTSTLNRVRDMYPDYSLNIKLEPLPVETCYTLLDEFLAAAKLTDAVRSLIVHQSGGNPYYLEEFVRMLVEQDYLRMGHGQLEVNQVLEMDQLNIPISLETLIRARVDSLPVSARQLLQIAAIIGRPFTRDLIEKNRRPR